jgi:ABC-type nitrate/sulfonate/bicarbonate transport system substrate-binding protein
MKQHHKSTRRPLTLIAAAVLGSMLLTACDSGADAGSGDTVTIGISGNIFDMSIQVADANGYFTKQGLQVKYVTLTASTGPSALQSGSVQFLNDSPTGFLSALGKGIPETAIATNGGGNPLGLVAGTKFAQAHGLTAASPAAEVAKALADSTGGASSANTKAEAGIFLKQYGVDPAKLKWVSLPSPAADKAALKSGQIDWFVTSEPTPLAIQDSGDGVVVADPIKVPAWSAAQAGYGQVVVASNSYLGQHADTAKKVAIAIQQGAAFMNANLDQPSVQAVAQKAQPGVPAAVLKASLEQVDWPANCAMNQADWDKTLTFINSLGALAEPAKISADNWTNKYLS